MNAIREFLEWESENVPVNKYRWCDQIAEPGKLMDRTSTGIKYWEAVEKEIIKLAAAKEQATKKGDIPPEAGSRGKTEDWEDG